MPRLALSDGYTLEGKTLDSLNGKSLPVVTFRYRPALPDALYEWRYATRMAGAGKGELDALVKLLADHLVSWDVTNDQNQDIKPTAENIRKVPEPILNDIMGKVASWAPKEMEPAAGNS